MMVRTLKPHSNQYGAHSIGDEYEHRRPEADMAFGYVVDAAEAEEAEEIEAGEPVFDPREEDEV
jgi:hypothetical protein